MWLNAIQVVCMWLYIVCVDVRLLLIQDHLNMSFAGLSLGLRPANDRRRYKVTLSLTGYAQTYNQACFTFMLRIWRWSKKMMQCCEPLKMLCGQTTYVIDRYHFTMSDSIQCYMSWWFPCKRHIPYWESPYGIYRFQIMACTWPL